jgi:hypothetical protein
VLQEIVEGVECKVGEQFFPSLVQQLATALRVKKKMGQATFVAFGTEWWLGRAACPPVGCCWL